MNRILLFLLLLCAGFAGCKNTSDVPAQIRAQQAVDDKIITAYLQKNLVTAKEVDSAGVKIGIYYVVDTLGSGNDVLTNSTKITVGYTGKNLQTGATFISTDEFHPSYVIGLTIPGWQYGILKSGIKKGGTLTLYVPSHYAYGPFAQPTYGLPANAILIFTIKIYNITN
jgi:FKBP-type peptidyl-prolyl cis-trans isomerase FkpA